MFFVNITNTVGSRAKFILFKINFHEIMNDKKTLLFDSFKMHGGTRKGIAKLAQKWKKYVVEI